MKKIVLAAGLVLLAGSSVTMAQTAPVIGADPRDTEAANLATQNAPQQNIATAVKSTQPETGKSLRSKVVVGPDIVGPIMAPLRRLIDPINNVVLAPVDSVTRPVTVALAPVVGAPPALFFDRPKPIPVVAATDADAAPVVVAKSRKKHRHKKVVASTIN